MKFAQSNRQIPNYSRPSTLFPKQFKDLFSFLKFKNFSRLVLNSRPVQEPCTATTTTATTTITTAAAAAPRQLIPQNSYSWPSSAVHCICTKIKSFVARKKPTPEKKLKNFTTIRQQFLELSATFGQNCPHPKMAKVTLKF